METGQKTKGRKRFLLGDALGLVRGAAVAPHFPGLRKRWGVERTFGGLMQPRPMGRDYEETETSATGFPFLTLVRLMLRRLA